ncbi:MULTISPECIES: AraC family transcriptional regulator [unclassified Phyllobacterium]|uniref:helix-turn-helix domain-containing protein n=1 Tax=Phyllobacterium TaxID=28100 RepID=UPI000DDBD2FA|nr:MULTISPECIES: AraC family transcriptional regulator [unclassified Phyllobacterium]MBA8902084.1 AraC-like DNA-binding protein [Phyllobacterium sp. P30BS-XVII]UGX88875.1 AraC family transcriptional regulator [Phyllobacterium sp. T1293]
MKQKRFVGNDYEVAVIWSDRISFSPHSHDEYVLSHNISGHERLKLDRVKIDAPQGSTTFYNPGQIQSGDGADFIVSIYLSTTFFQSAQIFNGTFEFQKPLICDRKIGRLFRNLISLGFDQDASPVIDETILTIIDHTSCRGIASHTVDKSIALTSVAMKAQKILLSNIDTELSLTELSAQMAIDKVSLVRAFTKETGVPPMTWQRAKRIELARDLLRKGFSPSDVAYRAGFADQAHLTRWFARSYGITPARFAKKQ